MAIKNDYLLDMIARFVDALMLGLGRGRGGMRAEAVASFEGVVGEVLDMDASVALSLAPTSLVTMLQLSAVDDSLAHYAAYALMRAADAYEDVGDATAALRRQQACAVADAYGVSADEPPAELADALAARENG